MAPYSVGHEHHLLPVSEHPQDDFCRQGSCRIYPHVSMGSSQPEGDSGRTSIGRRKPVGRVQASDRGEESAETQIHPDFQATVGVALQGMGSMASSGAPHATCDGQEMAYHGVPFLLGLEVKAEWPASPAEGDVGSDPQAEQRESFVEC